MGGHGGLNILPQKRWNVYNFDNREKVRRDEEAAAREESIRQQQQRQKDSEARLAKLRDAALAKHGGGATFPDCLSGQALDDAEGGCSLEDDAEEIQHIKLFDGLISFKRLGPGSIASDTCKVPEEIDRKIFRGDKELERLYKRATKEATRVGKDGVAADDEHYRLGYGCLDRSRKRPWYLLKGILHEEAEPCAPASAHQSGKSEKKQKKTIEELREERLKREHWERERAQKIVSAHPKEQRDGLGSVTDRKHRPYYNSSFGNAR